MGSENLLLEWLDPADEAKDKKYYGFNTIYVTIRIYGVSARFRSVQLSKSILQQVGQPSEVYPLHQCILFTRIEYM